jgi:hypothetical protein
VPLTRRGVSPAALAWSYRLLGIAVAAMALQEAEAGHLGVNAGALYGRRSGFLPLLPVAAMAALWLIQIAAGAAVALGWRRNAALRVAAAAVALGLTQSYFNQKMFLLLLLTSLALESMQAARAQLLLLYLASAAFKLRDGFGSGASLTALLEQVRDRGLAPWIVLPLAAAPALSKLALAGEALLPLALWKRPRAGVAAAVAMHLSFALFLPGLWPFTLTACAAALLFLPPLR